MYQLYSALLAIGLLLALPYWLWEMLRHGKYRTGLRSRLGSVPRHLRASPARPTVWVHAVSVGEVLAISGLVGQLRQSFPEFRVLVSTTTDAGQTLARARFGEENVFYFPLDFAFAVRPYLRALRPQLIVLAETEFWPNFLRLAHPGGALVAVVNARISDRSLPGYRRFRRLLREILRHVDLFLAQTRQDAARLRDIGAEPDRIQVSGNLKFDVIAPPAPPIVSTLRAALRGAGAGPIIVCGSTVEGEEPLLLEVFREILQAHPGAVMILAPRHTERFGEAARLLEQLGMRYWRRSRWTGEGLAGGVLLVDSIGELAWLYALGEIAFVGGSLVPRGGHNIIEPAQYGVPIIVGNHFENFRDIVELFQSRDAVRVARPAEFRSVLLFLLANQAERRALGLRALETLKTQTGATERTLDALKTLMEAASGGTVRSQ
jgi:3-deoxy-D-manno-octulosonic-acid transferase